VLWPRFHEVWMDGCIWDSRISDDDDGVVFYWVQMDIHIYI
jgi:hypothetical protein